MTRHAAAPVPTMKLAFYLISSHRASSQKLQQLDDLDVFSVSIRFVKGQKNISNILCIFYLEGNEPSGLMSFIQVRNLKLIVFSFITLNTQNKSHDYFD